MQKCEVVLHSFIKFNEQLVSIFILLFKLRKWFSVIFWRS